MPEDGIRVLHVDDDTALASMTADHLERADPRLSVTTAETPDAGLEVLSTEPIDVVVSDYDMPSTDGLAFLEAVRSEYGDVPFVVFTGEGSESVASEAIAQGVTDYIRKTGDADRLEVLANRLVTAVSRRRAESNYREIFEKATDGIAVHDPETGAIVDGNERFARMLGYDRETLLERSVADILVDDDPYTIDAARDRVRRAATGDQQVFEWVAETRTGEQFPVEVNLKAAVIGGQDRVLAFVRDISERKAHERALAALHETATELVTCDTEAAVYDTVVATAEDLIDCDYVIADTVVEDRLEPRAEVPQSPAAGSGAVPLDADQNLASRAYQRNEAVLVDDIHGPEGVPTESPYASVLSVPIGRHGVFQVASQCTNAFDEQDRELAELLVSHATAALDRLETDQDRRFEQERLVGLFRNLPAATVEYEMVEGAPVVRAVNPAFEAIFGYDEQTVLDRPLDEFVVPPEHVDQAATLNEQVAAGHRLDVEVRRRTADGARVFRLVNAPIESVADGHQRGYAIYRDVTEREEARRRLEAIVDHAEQAIYLKDRNGRYELVNEACAAIFDASPPEIVGQTDRDLFPEEEATRIESVEETVISERKPTTYERHVEIDGTARLLRNQKYPYEDASGAVAGVIGISTDVTDLRARERRLDALSTAFPDVAMIVDEAGRHLEVLASPESEDLLYVDPGELVGKRFEDLFGPEQAAAFQSLVDRTLATQSLQTKEYQLEVQVGTRWFEARTLPLASEVDGRRAVVWVARDITDRKRREEALQEQRDRLDEFAAVVSHDLRTPLNVANGHLELAREQQDAEHLDAIAEAHERMEALVETLLAVAKGEVEPTDRERVALASFVRQCWETVDTDRATLSVTTDRVVQADPTRLRQLVENLFVNSIEHGGIDVTVTVGDLQDGFFIEDDGAGIDAGDRTTIFESGYSEVGTGSGFGLSIVSQVATDHGWSVSATASDTGGARFEITGVEPT